MSIRDDVVLRAIHQLIEALLRAAGLRRKQDLPGAEQALGEGLGAIGLPLELIATLDPTTLRSLVPDDARRALVGAVLLQLGELRNDPRLVATGGALLDAVDREELPDDVREAVAAVDP